MKKSNRLHMPQSVFLPTSMRSTISEEDVSIPASLLPAQFFTPSYESHINWTGERLLMLAVLQEAVHSYYRYATAKTYRGKRLFSETRDWFWSREHEYLYSFESICLHLHLDPDYVRRGLQRSPQSAEVRVRIPRASHRQRTLSGSNPATLAA